MSKYKERKPSVDAIQWDGGTNLTPIKEWFESFSPDEWSANCITGASFQVRTSEGAFHVSPKDFIVRDEDGNYNLFNPEIFHLTYEPS